MKKKEYTAPQALVVTMATVLPVAVSGEDTIERNNDSGDPNNDWSVEKDGKYWID